jgi:putative endonuclease
MLGRKRFVYILRSNVDPGRYYTGLTGNPYLRLREHTAGKCPHTSNGRPWMLDVALEFADEQRALAFERYLESGSGCAFAKRHLR